MATLEELADANDMTDFIKSLQENHLAQVIAAKYERNPILLGEHFALNFIPLPPGPCGDDPAEDVLVIVVTYKPKNKVPNFGNLLIPTDHKGIFCEFSRVSRLIRGFRLVSTVFLPV